MSKIRIGIDIDILGLPNPYTGIPNYLRRLVEAIIVLSPGAVRFYLLSRRPVYRNSELPSHVSQVVIKWPLGQGWQSVALQWAAQRLKLNLLHLPAFTVPFFTSCPVAVTVHDLAYLAYPEYCTDDTVSYLSRRVPAALKKASAVITPSAFVKDECIRYFDLPPSKIYPVLHGVSPEFKVLPEESLIKAQQELNLPEHFFLFVGTIEPRKNLTRLIEAFGRVVAQGLNYYLVLAGTKGWKCSDIYTLSRQLGIEHRVLFLGYVSDSMLPALYNAATIFVYPSLYEGFGLPLLEAMACGTPVIAANDSSLPEVVSDAGLLVDPLDIDKIASTMFFLAKNEEVRHKMTQKGFKRAKQFSWERTARETVRIYEAAVKSTNN